MKIGIVFAGQGSQYVGMGKDFYESYISAKEIYDNIKMDFNLSDVCFNGPIDVLNQTEYTQSCILATSIAIYNVMQSLGIQPSYLAGLSLGEYSALVASGCVSLQDALEIVRERGLIMANSLPAGTSKMAAVMSDDLALIQQACEYGSIDGQIVTIANYNAYNQIVITGNNEAVDKAIEYLKDNGVRRIVPLKVSGAFHSPLLENASNELEKVLDRYTFNEFNCPVVFNVSGKVEHENIKQLLKQQIKSSVLFYQSIETMIEHGVDTFIEIGPGHTLSNLIKKINKEVKVYCVDSVLDLQNLAKEFQHA